MIKSLLLIKHHHSASDDGQIHLVIESANIIEAKLQAINEKLNEVIDAVNVSDREGIGVVKGGRYDGMEFTDESLNVLMNTLK